MDPHTRPQIPADGEGQDTVPLREPDPADAGDTDESFGNPYISNVPPPSAAGGPVRESRSDAVGPADEVIIGGGLAEDSGEYDLAPDPEPSPEPRLRGEAPKTVRDERNCRTCGYLLLGLPLDSRCPECGTPIAASGDSDLLRHASHDWLGQLVLGCRIIMLGLLFGTAAYIVAGWITSSPAVLGAVGFAGSAAVFAGVWLLTMPDPSNRGERNYGTRRKAVRILAGFGAAAAICEAAAATPGLSQAMISAFGFAAAVLSLPWIGGHAMVALYLSRLAARIPEPYLEERARSVGSILFILLGAGVLLVAVMIAVAVLAANGMTAGGGMASGALCSVCVGALLLLAMLGVMILYLVMLEQFAKAIDAQRKLGEFQTDVAEMSPGRPGRIQRKQPTAIIGR